MNNKLLYKKILIAIIAVTLAILVMLGSFVFYFDPFFHYHKPYEGVKVLFDNEAYQNAGVARNFDYDSVIVGSSMTKLFRASDFDQAYDCKSVQLTYSGGTIKNFSLILDQVFNHKKEDIRYVFWGLDLFALESGKDQLKQDLPGYLYDDNVFSDVSYLYNKAVYQQIITNIYEGNNLDYDLMWDDENDNTFCQKNAIKDKDINTVFADDGVEPYKFGTCSIPEGVIDNVEQNIIPIVEEHKDVKFIFFIPAYSLIYWNSNGYIYGRMPDLISEIDYVYEKLSQYENVEFHMLQLMPETSNLYMYMDSLHNNYQVAKAVPKALKSSQYKVTTDNKEELYGEFYDYVMNSDYKIYTGEKYPFQNEVKLASFFDMIEDEKYTKVILISSQIGELNEDELNELKSRNYIPSDYTGGDYFGIKGDENIFSIETLAYSFASDDGVASLKIDDVEYVAVPKMMMILVVDNETGRVVDVGGLRDDTRELTKY